MAKDKTQEEATEKGAFAAAKIAVEEALVVDKLAKAGEDVSTKAKEAGAQEAVKESAGAQESAEEFVEAKNAGQESAGAIEEANENKDQEEASGQKEPVKDESKAQQKFIKDLDRELPNNEKAAPVKDKNVAEKSGEAKIAVEKSAEAKKATDEPAIEVLMDKALKAIIREAQEKATDESAEAKRAAEDPLRAKKTTEQSAEAKKAAEEFSEDSKDFKKEVEETTKIAARVEAGSSSCFR